MSDFSAVVATGVSAALVPVVVRFIVGRTNATAVSEDGVSVLRYGRGYAIFLAVAAVLLLGLMGALLLLGDLDAEGRRICLAIAALFVALFVFGALDLAYVAHGIDEDGIERRTPWRRHVRVQWKDVVKVRYEPTARIFIKSRSGDDVRVPIYLTGLGTLAALILRRVDSEALDANARNGLAELAKRQR